MVTKEAALKGSSQEMKVSASHYVLKNSMKGPWPEGLEVAVFANGCFWGSEKGMWRLPGGGVYSTAVGYAAGYTPNPTYEEACSGRTGHTEAVQVVYDPNRISYVDLLRWHWESHNPTAGMGQGNDRGTQYRSGIYPLNEAQKKLAEASLPAYQKALKEQKGISTPITTEIVDGNKFDTIFYYAEDYHQQYLAKPGARPYCSAEPQEVDMPPFETWAPKGMESHAPKLTEDFWKVHKPTFHCVIKAPTAPIKWP